MSQTTARSGRYEHVLRFVAETPWALEEQTWLAIRELLVLRAQGEAFTEKEIEARIGGGPGNGQSQMVGNVAIIPISGVIIPRADMFTRMSGGTSVQGLQQVFREHMQSKDVKAIVLDVNSPGGSTDLITELAQEVRQARGRKPVVAVANTKMTSAAYWIASQADEVVATPSSGSIGSIGVFAAHEDLSGLEEKLGTKTTLISSHPNKVLGNPFEPLSEEARREIQARVDEQYAMFTSDVAKGRKVAVAHVRDEDSPFGNGKVFGARAALKTGLIDRIDTLEATVERLNAGRAAPVAVAPDEPDVILDDSGDSDSRRIDVTIVGDVSQSEVGTFVAQAMVLRVGADDLHQRVASLAEVQRGHLTGAKRESLTACTGALRETVAALEQLLADTDPDRIKRDVERESLAFLKMAL